MIQSARLFGAVLILLASPTLAAGAQTEVLRDGETLRCPNGFAMKIVRHLSDGSVVLSNTTDRTETIYTPAAAAKGTLYQEQGALPFFALWVPADGSGITLQIPDGPVPGCTVTPEH